MDAKEALEWVTAACRADPQTANALEFLESDRTAKRDALRGLFQMMDAQTLVRNTDGDTKPDWAYRMLRLVERLQEARKAAELP